MAGKERKRQECGGCQFVPAPTLQTGCWETKHLLARRDRRGAESWWWCTEKPLHLSVSLSQPRADGVTDTDGITDAVVIAEDSPGA